ncbi:MAG: purine-binding chemotaxis protein CheW, partial [Deltaproteobacteria bacterium]|nr:purine-binding chemotaxis protein CheW [Deltaproteobacteria bacterium]
MDMSTNSRTPAQPQPAPVTQFLTFFLGQEEFGLELLRVRQIVEYTPVTRVPHLPSSIRGVINLRGLVLPVIDLANKFGLPEQAITRRTCIVIADTEEAGPIGVLVDAVNQASDIAQADIAPAPAFATIVRADYLIGLAKVNERFVLLLDAARVLSPAELLAATTVDP